MPKHCKTHKITARGLTHQAYAPLVVPVLQDIANRVAYLWSDGWLLLNLHLERNPSGPHRLDVHVIQSYFEHVLKYCTNRPQGMNAPQNPGPINIAVNPLNPAAVPDNAITRGIARFYLHETAYSFFQRCNSEDYSIFYLFILY